MISHLGPQLAVANGIALANKLRSNKKVTAVFTGDGGTSEGDFHEAINVASVWNLPVIFVIENNGYGLSTPSSEQFNCKQFSDKGIGYGIDAYTIDGNNIIDVYKKVLDIKKNMLIDPKPVILECMTFRMRGHEEASGTKYVPKILMNKWSKRDPLNNYEEFLNKRDILSSKSIKELKIKINNDINDAWKISDSQPSIKSTTQDELKDVYRFYSYKEISPSKNQISQRLVDALSDALKLSMLKHDNLVLMGQDIAEYGGVFKITEGFVEVWKKRVETHQYVNLQF